MEKQEKVASFPSRGSKKLRTYSLPDLKQDKKHLIRIPSLNFPEIRPSGTFWSGLSNGYHGNDYRFVFTSSVTVQSLITITWQEKEVSMIKIFKFFVSDHLK